MKSIGGALLVLLAGCGNISAPVEDACDFLTDQLNAEIAIFQEARDLGHSRTRALAEWSFRCQLDCFQDSLPDVPITVAACVTLCIDCGDVIADLVYGPELNNSSAYRIHRPTLEDL